VSARRVTASWMRAGRRALAGFPVAPVPCEMWARRRRALAEAVTLVRVFYLCLFLILLDRCDSWEHWWHLQALSLLWPVAWFAWTGIRAGVVIVVTASLAGALVAGVMPHVRAYRVAAAAGLWVFAAFFNSFGVVNHALHVWVWAAVLFVLLPDGGVDHLRRCTGRAQRYLRVFWSAQAAVLLFYSLSGSFKLAGAALQISRGQVSVFSPTALARHAAVRLTEIGRSGPGAAVGGFVIDHPYVGWPLFLTALYVEVFSVVVAFRPALHRAWGVCLISIHLGICFTLSILFSWHMLLVGLLLICSPAAPLNATWWQVAGSLPVWGDVMAWAGRIRGRRAAARLWPGLAA